MGQGSSVSIKEMFGNDIVITKILQGNNRTVRIDSKRRFPKPDHENIFSKWCSRNYANTLARENYGKNIEDFNCYNY